MACSGFLICTRCGLSYPNSIAGNFCASCKIAIYDQSLSRSCGFCEENNKKHEEKIKEFLKYLNSCRSTCEFHEEGHYHDVTIKFKEIFEVKE